MEPKDGGSEVICMENKAQRDESEKLCTIWRQCFENLNRFILCPNPFKHTYE
jgi:hypothetical protein